MRTPILVFLLVAFAQASAADTRYFLEPMTAEPYIESSGSKSAIADNVIGRVRKVCGQKLTDSEADAGGRVRLHIVELKKVSGGSRFLIGPFRGNSYITIRLTVLDAMGKETKSKLLNRRGNWFLGSVTVGATDNKMLTNIAEDVCYHL